jgi:transaldolase
MQLFLDSAIPKDIEKAYATGLIDGVTTNPSLASKAKMPYKQIVEEILQIVKGPVSLETISTDFDGIVKEAAKLAKLSKNIVVKIPCTPSGYRATKELSSEGVNINMTLCFSLNQAILAAKAGAYFVSPFVGRLDDISEHSGDELIKEIKKVYDLHQFKTKILAASIRDTEHVENVALLGADIATLPLNVFENMFNHQLTDKGLQKFLEDWNSAGLSLPV